MEKTGGEAVLVDLALQGGGSHGLADVAGPGYETCYSGHCCPKVLRICNFQSTGARGFAVQPSQNRQPYVE